MTSRRFIVGAALAAATSLASLTTAEGAESPGRDMVLVEHDCAEITIPRAANVAATRAEVPPRYGLFTQATPTGGTVARAFLYTYTCQSVTVDGTAVPGMDQPTTVSIGAAQINSRDGEALQGLNFYVFWYGTDNPELYAQMRALDLPARLLTPDTSATLSFGEPQTQSIVRWEVHSPHVDYQVRGTAVEPTPPTGSGSPIAFWHDSARGDLQWRVHNDRFVSTSARIQADLREATPLPGLLANPALALVPVNVGINDDDLWATGFSYARGSWTSHISLE